MTTRLFILFTLALCLSVWLTYPIAEASAARVARHSEFAGQVVAIHGAVAYRSNSHNEWAAVNVGQVLRPGGQVRTGNEARATVYLASGEIVRLPPNSQLTLVEANLGQVAPTTTPNGVASIRG